MTHPVDDTSIDVRYEVDPDKPLVSDGRPVLTWGTHPIHGNCWTLWKFENSQAVEGICIPGDLSNVEPALDSARKYLAHTPDPETD